MDIFSEKCEPDENNKASSSSEFREYDDDNSDNDELYVKKKELTEEGAKLEGWLKKNSSTSGPRATDAWKSNKVSIWVSTWKTDYSQKSMLTGLTKPAADSVNVGIARFDKFQISVRNPKISSSSFGAFTAGMKLEKLSDLKPTSSFKGKLFENIKKVIGKLQTPGALWQWL